MEPMFFFLIFAVIVGVIGFSIYQTARMEEAWKNTANRLSLTLDEGGFFSTMSMTGTYRGKRIDVQHEKETRGGGKNRNTVHFAAIRVNLQEPCWRRISLSPHSFGDSVAKFFGGEDRSVGDSSFDSDFRIKGSMDEELRDCLGDSSVQSAIRGISRMYGSFKVQNGVLSIRERGMFTCENELTRMIERTIDTAEVLDEAAGGGGTDESASAEEALFPDFESQPSAGGEQPSPIW